MERESNSMQPKCRSGCGFYGNTATDELCAVCKQQQPVSSTPVSVPSPQPSPIITITNTIQPTVQSLQQPHHEVKEKLTSKDNSAKSSSEAVSGAGPTTSTPSAVDEQDQKDKDNDAKKKKDRCAECRKKVGLTGLQCRCGGLFCAVHRYSDKHNCTFNYREHGAQEIRRNNPVVVGEKIQKI